MSDFESRLLRAETDDNRLAIELASDEARLAGLENTSWLTALGRAGAGISAVSTTWNVQVYHTTIGGAAVAGATVEIDDPAGAIVASGTTNGSGAFSSGPISVPSAYAGLAYILKVTKSGMNPSPFFEQEPFWDVGFGSVNTLNAQVILY